jgi:putative acetyltransferase
LAPDVLSIKQENPAQSDVAELLRHGEAFSASLYPPESSHHLPLDALRRPEARFFVARDTKGTALATGALVLHDGWAEIKRMWVEEAARGRGIARRVLNVLIGQAASAGIEILRLETGVMPRLLYMKRLASNAGRPLATIAPTLSASSWKDLSIFCKHKNKCR